MLTHCDRVPAGPGLSLDHAANPGRFVVADSGENIVILNEGTA